MAKTRRSKAGTAEISALTPKGREIIRLVAGLVDLIQESGWDDIEGADSVLREFDDAWTRSGDGMKLPGCKSSSLAAVDTTNAIREALKLALESL